MRNSQPIPAIRKLGFRRWFERQLIESHVYLVTCILCLIVVLAALERLSTPSGTFERVLISALMVCAGSVGLVSLERYRSMLFRALHLSGRSNCEKCGAYAKFHVIDSARADSPATIRDCWMKVKCRKCGHQWIME